MFSLNVNASITVSTVEEARLVGQAVERLLQSTNTMRGSVKLSEVPSHKNIPLHPAIIDRSKVVTGVQEAQGRIGSIVKEVEKIATDTTIPVDVFWAELYSIALTTGKVDVLTLTKLVQERTGSEDPAGVIANIYGVLAQNEIKREIMTLSNPRTRK